MIVIDGDKVDIYCDPGVGLDIIEVPKLDCYSPKAEALKEQYVEQRVRWTQQHLFPGIPRKMHNIRAFTPSELEAWAEYARLSKKLGEI